MFAVDDAAANAIQTAYTDGGELSAVVEFRRHFPLIDDNEHARRCVRMIVGWKPIQTPVGRRVARAFPKKPLTSLTDV